MFSFFQISVESDGKNASTKVRIHIQDPTNGQIRKEQPESDKPDEVETGPEDQQGDVVDDETVDESSRSDNFAFSVKENVGGNFFNLLNLYRDKIFVHIKRNYIFHIGYLMTLSGHSCILI